MSAQVRRMLPALLSLSAALFTFGPAVAQAPNPATRPEPRKDDWWMNRHKAFVATAAKGGVDVLFIGDSITEGWGGNGKEVWKTRFAKWHPANFGIGGDRTQHVLWRITEGKELTGIDPKVIVLMIGTNNVGSNTPAEIADGIEAIVAECRKQKAVVKVLLLGVFPRSGARVPKDVDHISAEKLNPAIKSINERIAKLDDGKDVKYLDIGGSFLDEKGGLSRTVMDDFLHLTPKGYALWADAIQEPVEKLLK